MSEFGFADVLTLAQTIAIIAALLVTLYFSRQQAQAFQMDLETRVLNEIDEKFHRIGEVIIERPELVRSIYRSTETPTPAVPFNYYLVMFCSHIFHMRERGVLGDNEWAGWYQWMRNSFAHGEIGTYWRAGAMETWFDPAFRSFVERELLRDVAPPG